ncbi:Sperm-specific class P protein 32 [Toxocara canis]|uniref:Major sperm protein n=1 Tax=Toxocara canis TaxID=6265 RepID=A0A0B2V2R7_TOXCA|nr:Sperm-specific class P protein 32 [Toxocara canis]
MYYYLLICALQAAIVILISVQCASNKRPSMDQGQKSASTEKNRKGIKSSSKSVKSASKKSLKSGKSVKSSKSKRLAADRGQSMSSSRRSKSSGSVKKVKDKAVKGKCQKDNKDAADAVKAEGEQMDIIVQPDSVRWKATGGIKKIELSNAGSQRQAIKVKCTDNDLYRVNPVFTFVEPGQTISFDVIRNNGGIKDDKLIFLATKASEHDARPRELFKAGIGDAVAVLPLVSASA